LNKYLFKGKIRPDNAVCALILYNNKILLQKRDNKKNIFFPNHYGLFGGALNKNETKKRGLIRELKEELDIEINIKKLKYLTSIDLDFSTIQFKKYNRTVYVIRLQKEDIKKIKLFEGEKMIWLNKKEAYFKRKIVPYDAFAIWLYLFKKS
tara:strand:+ start:52 stop:504 length:453 start_codon:yes stop_codon:yes gene_type:complete